MGIRRTLNIIRDELYYLFHNPEEDGNLVRFYRLSYVFANGCDYGVPNLYFSEGGYWLEGISVDKNNCRLDYKYTPRAIERMTKRLINRRLIKEEVVLLEGNVYKFIYNTLTQKEKAVIDGKQIRRKYFKSKYINYNFIKLKSNQRIVRL